MVVRRFALSAWPVEFFGRARRRQVRGSLHLSQSAPFPDAAGPGHFFGFFPEIR